jgi:DNA-binding response OmpR family regulator/nitrogen-specific signal transduction histidine kinase
VRILLVEDNSKLAETIKVSLTQQGYTVDIARSAAEADEIAVVDHHDVIILDVVLPDRNGIELCRQLRRQKVATPILMLSVQSTTADKVAGLDAGADDYLSKPFQGDELLARLRSLLRRTQAMEGSVLRSGDLVMDLQTHQVTLGGKPVRLSAKEFALLEYMMRNTSRLLTRAMISESVWDMNYEASSNVIDVYVSSLRRKIDLNPKRRHIETMIGSGYRFIDQPESNGDSALATTIVLCTTTPVAGLAVVLAASMLMLGACGWLFHRRTSMAITAAAAGVPPLQEQLEETLARITALTNAKGRFVGNIAHEIKTPLTIVLSQLDLLLSRSNDPEAVRAYARSIAEDMRHLADLVDSFLRLARPFAQEDTSHHIPVYVHDCVLEAVQRSRALARESGVTIVPTLMEAIDGDIAPEVLGDPVLIEAMIENLVRNAVRFSRHGSRVEVQVQGQGEMLLVYVRDHGTGIAPENLESVFDWFFQEPGLLPHASGTGFGLAIAKRIAEHHGGTITLRNRVTGGCEFAITLPRWQAEDSPPTDPGDLMTPAHRR